MKQSEQIFHEATGFDSNFLKTIPAQKAIAMLNSQQSDFEAAVNNYLNDLKQLAWDQQSDPLVHSMLLEVQRMAYKIIM